MATRLKDKVAIVTGSGQGIGKAIAIAMANEGAKVVANDYEPGIAESVAKQIVESGGKAIAFVGDISNFDVAQKLIQKAVDSFGHVDILINNAGILKRSPFWDITEKCWDNVVGVSLKGCFNCSRHACVFMKEQRWGRIISASSTAAFSTFGAMEHTHYAAAKAGIIGFTRNLGKELGPYGVTCNAYCPSAGTRMTLSEYARMVYRRKYESGIIRKETYNYLVNLPGPETIPPLIVYLSTDEAANINGQLFRIDGNRIAIYSDQLETNEINKKEGLWTIEELDELVPRVVLHGYNNPAPAK